MLKRLLLLIVSLGMSILFVEGTLRQFPIFDPVPYFIKPDRPLTEGSGIFIPDPEIGWRLKPNYSSPDVTSNAQGFRALHDFNPQDRPIVFVGDSFTYGTGVLNIENYPSLIERRLGKPIVDNMAIPGFGVHQVWMTVRHKVLELNPRMIVVGIVEVDFERSQRAFDFGKQFRRPWYGLVNGQLVDRTDVQHSSLVVWLDNHSRWLRMLRLALQTAGHHVPVGEWWNLNAAFLDDIQRMAKESGIPVLFVNLPTMEWRGFPMLRKHMQDIGADFVDVTEGRAYSPELFNASDRHPSVAGHRLIADVVWERIVSLLDIDKLPDDRESGRFRAR